MTDAFLSDARQAFHSALLQNNILSTSEKSVPSNADASSRVSVAIANGILEKLGRPRATEKLRGQIAGATFERVCAEFIDVSFRALGHMRPGHWVVGKGGNVAHYDQYSHLAALEVLARQNRELWAALGSDYLIKPDIVIARDLAPNFYPAVIGVWASVVPCWAVVAAVRGAEPSVERSAADRRCAA